LGIKTRGVFQIGVTLGIEFFPAEPLFFAARSLSTGKMEKAMKSLLILLSAAAAIAFYAPAPSHAQGIGIGVPGVGIQIGEPDRPRYRERRRDYDRSQFREREVRSDRGCRTVTIQHDDGSVRRIRRCD
jgi:hypothetical protein